MTGSPQTFEGMLTATDMRFGIVCARFNDFFVAQLLDGAMDAIVRHGGSIENIQVARVPGCYDLPLVAQVLARSGKVDAVIALGAVIQGATPHAALINSEVTKALSQIALATEVPVTYGIINADTIEQAIERSGTKAGNKGADAAVAAVEMVNVLRSINANTPRRRK